MHKGDVLFGKRRAFRRELLLLLLMEFLCTWHGLRPKEEVVDKAFFPIFISSDYFLDAAIKIEDDIITGIKGIANSEFY